MDDDELYLSRLDSVMADENLVTSDKALRSQKAEAVFDYRLGFACLQEYCECRPKLA